MITCIVGFWSIARRSKQLTISIKESKREKSQ
jgi:hypothetical protein